MARLPKYALHKASGQARVMIGGKSIYLGPYGSDESKAEYRRLIDRLQLQQKAGSHVALTVGELILLYDDHAESYYRHPDGSVTSELSVIRSAMKPLAALQARVLVIDFGPRRLREVQEEYVRRGVSRPSTNAYLRRVIGLFKWGVAQEFVLAEIHAALKTVGGLKLGRTKAREPGPVKPVPIEHVNSILPHVPEAVSAAIRVQLLTASRAGEILSMRFRDVDRTESVWRFVPMRHKNSWRSKARTIFIGPRAQAVLEKFIEGDAEAPCFRKANGHAYSTPEVGRLIAKACKASGTPHWSPHMLRHAAASAIRKQFDLESAGVVLGHDQLQTSQIYAQKNEAKAREIMLEIG